MRAIALKSRSLQLSSSWITALLALVSISLLSNPALAAPKPKPAGLTITTTALAKGAVGTTYSQALLATGGTQPYNWSLTGGTLPAGLSFSSSGIISGVPTAPANSVLLTFKVADSSHPALTSSTKLSLTISPLPLSVTTNSLPSGQVGVTYNSSLSASGGTQPYVWTQTGGSLPAGLTLSTTGTITGNPTSAGTATGLIFKVADSGSQTSQTASLSITISPAPPSVTVTPKAAGLTVTQTISLIATTTDGSSLNWTASGQNCSGSACGTFSATTTTSGAAVTYTAPGTAGWYSVTATDANNVAVSSSINIGVTDLAGVTTYHNNASRNGVNSQEWSLTPGGLTASTFGKLFSCGVDGAIYAQPLWLPNLVISGTKHNVIIVATQHDSLYAIDADASPCTILWHANLIDAGHGGTAGETSVPNSLVGSGFGDIAPEIGATGTPVADAVSNLLYVVSKSVDSSGTNFFQRLHRIDLITGNETLAAGPQVISGSFPSNSGTVAFSAKQQNQRASLALVNGAVYVAWAGHEDADPWYGWLMSFDSTTLAPIATFNSSPNASRSGIWMGGGGPSFDPLGNLYVITGNGNFDVTSSSPPNNDYGDSFLKLSSDLTVSQYFSPADQSTDNQQDNDFGSGGSSVVVDLPANGTLPNHLVIGGGKDGNLCLLNYDAMGGFSKTNAGAVQVLTFGNGIYGTPAFWNWSFYLAGDAGKLQQFTLNQSTYKINTSPASTSSVSFGFPGATPAISARPDGSSGIVWAIDNSLYCTPQSPGCGPAVLHAYDASNLGVELWNSSQGSGNAAGNAVKFTVPTVANGKVYIGTRGNNTGGANSSTTIPGELDVYGLLGK